MTNRIDSIINVLNKTFSGGANAKTQPYSGVVISKSYTNTDAGHLPCSALSATVYACFSTVYFCIVILKP